MILEDYLQNPLGKGISMLSGTRDSLDRIYETMRDHITIKWYLVLDQYLIAHVKIPSNSIQNLKYDVLFEFNTKSIEEGKTTINRAISRVFSNCPSFTYTYAYVFNTKGDVCPWARGKYDPEVLVKQPKIRNPYEIESYERSLYLAGKYILSGGRNFTNRILLTVVKTNDYSYILNTILSDKQILQLYNSRREKQRKEAQAEKARTTSKSTPAVNKKPNTNMVNHTSKTTTMTTAKTMVNTNKTNTTKKTKKI